MCKSKKPKSQPAGPTAEQIQAKAELEATQKANAEKADRKRYNRTSSLATGAGFSDEDNGTFG